VPIRLNICISIGSATIGVDGEDTYFSHLSITDISNMVFQEMRKLNVISLQIHVYSIYLSSQKYLYL
jgi:hypothetical protein